MKVLRYINWFIRSTIFNIVFPMLSIVAYCFISFPVYLMYGKGWGDVVQKLWGKMAMWLLRVVCGITYEVRGVSNLPKTKKGFIVASKHQSMWETIVFINYFEKASYILKKQLLYIPFYGWAVAATSNIAVNRSGKSVALRDMTAKAKKAIKKGARIIIFPQGTRTPAGASLTKYPYKSGVVALYKSTDCKVIPVALNSGMYWSKRKYVKRPGKIIIEFLPAIESGMDKREFRKELQNSIETATDRLIEEAKEAQKQ